jgi:hypothetical protein
MQTNPEGGCAPVLGLSPWGWHLTTLKTLEKGFGSKQMFDLLFPLLDFVTK